MQIGKITAPFIFLSFASLSNIAHADNGFIAPGVKASTLGLGLELDFALSENFNTRLQLNSYTTDDTFEEDGISYSGEISLASYGGIVDWRPFAGSFRLSAGLYVNENELSGTAVSAGNEVFNIGDLQYVGVASDPLSLQTNIELGSGSVGYLGFGWGNNISPGLTFSFELGVLFSGAPEVSFDYSGTARETITGLEFDVTDSSNPLVAELQQEIDKEIATLEQDIDDFEYYPVLSLGIAYRF